MSSGATPSAAPLLNPLNVHHDAGAGGGTQLAEGEEVARVEVDRRLGSRGRGVPGRAEELAVRLHEAHRTGGDPLRREHGDRGIRREVVGDRNEPVDQRGREGFHAVDRDALRDFGEHLREARELVLHLLRALAHLGAEQHLAARGKLDLGHCLGERTLVGHREEPQRLEFVAEELGPHRMLGVGREHVDDATAHGELAATGDHVDPHVGEVHEFDREPAEVVAATARREAQRLEAREVVGERLQGRANARHDHDVGRLRTGGHLLRPVLQAAKGVDALADGLGARAESLVRQRLPGRELDDLGGGQDAGKRTAERFGVASGGDDGEQRLRTGSTTEKPGEKRRPQTVDQREVGAPRGVIEGGGERLGARKRRNQALKDHRRSLRTAYDSLGGQHRFDGRQDAVCTLSCAAVSPSVITSSTASAASDSRFGSSERSVADEVAQHEVGGGLPARRSTDPDTHANEVGRAGGRDDVPDAVVTSVTSAVLEPHGVEGDVELVVQHDEPRRRDLEVLEHRGDGSPRQVHEAVRCRENNAGAAGHETCLGDHRVGLVATQGGGCAAREFRDHHLPHVVPIGGVAGPGVAEPDYEPRGVVHDAFRCEKGEETD